jgi:hypothetical protein
MGKGKESNKMEMAKRVKCPLCKPKKIVLKIKRFFFQEFACEMCDGKGEIILKDGSEICGRCKGLGSINQGTDTINCNICKGTGNITCGNCHGLGKRKLKSGSIYTCPSCNNSGEIKCYKCSGFGKVFKCDKCGGSGIFKIDNLKNY